MATMSHSRREGNMNIFQRPQCLIETGSSGKLKVRKEVLTELQQLNLPLVVVSIAGLYRTGKSYLMNKLAGVSKGFALGSTIESKTKGIWVWAQRHPLMRNSYLLLLDTEGLGDAKKADPDHDNWVFTLAVLLSSTFVYNFLGAISEDMFSKLHFISEISKKIKIRSQDSEGETTDFDAHFPRLIFTARDFSLELIIDGEEVTADEYLEDALGLSDTQSKESQVARKCIRQYFVKRKCFTFDRPGDRDTLKMLEALEEKDLARSFVKDTKIFLDYIWNECPRLSLPNGQNVNGPMFATLVEMYIGSIQKGEVPCIESAFTVMAKRENEKVIAEVLDKCYRRITESGCFPTDTDEEMADLLKKSQKEAVESFVPRAVFDVEGIYKRRFLEQLEVALLNIEEENREHSQKSCRKALEGLGSTIKERCDSGFYMRAGGYELYTGDMDHLQQQYQQLKNLGVLKRRMLGDYFEEESRVGKAILNADEKISKEEKQREETRKMMAIQTGQMMKQKEEIRLLKETHDRQVQIAEETARRMEEKLQREIEVREIKMKEIDQKRNEELLRLREEGQKNIQELKKQQDESRQQQKRELEEVRKNVEQENIRYMERKDAEYEDKMSAMREEVDEIKGHYESELSEMTEELKNTRVQYKDEMTSMKDKYEDSLLAMKEDIHGRYKTEMSEITNELRDAKAQSKSEADTILSLGIGPAKLGIQKPFWWPW